MNQKSKLWNFIFDMDGLLVDTQTPFHATAESMILLKHHGVTITPENLSERFAGISTKKVFKELIPESDPEFLVTEKWKEMFRLVKENQIVCLPGMYELIPWLHKNGNKFAIASASPKEWIELCIKNARPYDFRYSFQGKLAQYFDGLYFSAEDCKNPKPAPDVFLKAFSVIYEPYQDVEFLKNNTFVVGDGRADVLAGLAAGMPVLYLSENKEFDENPKVKRFSTSQELVLYIRTITGYVDKSYADEGCLNGF